MFLWLWKSQAKLCLKFSKDIAKDDKLIGNDLIIKLYRYRINTSNRHNHK